jgi:FMN-dependent oxidoreductase (nitrilotriacetate monooxygenase family)
MERREMKLGMFVRPSGHHIASWRHPRAAADANVNFPHYVEMAKIAERGLFDMLFSADQHTIWTVSEQEVHRVHYSTWFEPVALFSALSAYTKNIGLVSTASTTFEQPYSIARRFATLDLISGGRAGWNVVTSSNETESQNYGLEQHLDRAERYKRSQEFVEVVRGLWDSWDEGAFIRDRESGIYMDRSKMHELNHHGEHFNVRGPLNVARSPQGQPVIVQAGASGEGRELAAKTAEVVFTATDSIDRGREFYGDVKGRMARYGRQPDDMKIMPGLLIFVAPTREEAQAKFQALQDLLHPELGIALLSRRIGFDLSGYPLDEPLPELPENKNDSRSEMVKDWSGKGAPTLREVYQRFAGARGHTSIIGTPTDVADYMQEWVETGASDGFNIVPAYFNDGLIDIVDTVIPELQRRGIFRKAYEGTTLRKNLGLRVPQSRYFAETAQ